VASRPAREFVRQVIETVARDPAIVGVELAGSRARGEETALSDWDFAIGAPDFEAAAAVLPRLVEPLRPLAAQWDRLSPFPTYMLMLRGPLKLDFLFLDRPNPPAPAWRVSAETLPAIDAHFWDWILWLASKETARPELVEEQLALLQSHLLAPMGAARRPAGVDEALNLYLERREALEQRLGRAVPRALEREVRPAVTGRSRAGTGS
jgi:hypothetical protein